MTRLRFNPDLAIWMRRAGIPVGIIAEQLGTNRRMAADATAGNEPFDMGRWQSLERSIVFARSTAAERGRRIANGRRALRAYRAAEAVR